MKVEGPQDSLLEKERGGRKEREGRGRGRGEGEGGAVFTNGLSLIRFISDLHIGEVLPHLLHQFSRSEADSLKVVCPVQRDP
jgi:hypothetical protein